MNCYIAPSSTCKQDRFSSRNSGHDKAYVYSFHLAINHIPEPPQDKPPQHISSNNGFHSSQASQGEQDYTSQHNPPETIAQGHSENQGGTFCSHNLPLPAQ